MTLTTTCDEPEFTPVMALHSSASSGAQWNRLANDLEGRFSVLAPNLPGYGPDCLVPATSAKGHAAAALPVIAEILKQQKPVHLIGHSNGAAIALKVAMLRPDLIKSLTLYEPCTFHLLRGGDQNDKDLYAEIMVVSDALAAGAASGNPEPGMRTFLEFWNEPGTWDKFTDKTKRKYARLAKQVASDFAKAFEEDWDPHQLKNLPMPTLLLMGLDSPEIAQRVTTLVSDAIPGSRLALLPGLGHMAPITDPEWVNLRLFDHIAKAERSAAHCLWPFRTAA